MMTFELRPKNIIVVGGASGIGLATAQKLLDYGCSNVLLASRNETKLQDAAKSLRVSEAQKVYTLPFDIAKVGTHLAFLEQAAELLGTEWDGLVLSSGVNFGAHNWRGFNISEEDYDRVMDINLKGVFFLMRNFANNLFSRGLKGNICIVSSISAHRDLLSVYQVSKNAISGIVHAYGKHLVERGIVLNCVEPGTINTDMMKHLAQYTDGVRSGDRWKDNSIGRLIRPEEIADTICFLMSNLGEVMSGTCLLAGGGCKSIAK